MRACRLFSLARKSAPFSLQNLAPFSASAAATLRSSNYSTDEEEEEGFSAKYRDALKFQRPLTIKSTELRFNSVSFIGSVCLPPKIITSRMGDFGVLATLDVKNSPESEPSLLRISLIMWGKMAHIFLERFTCNDFICVSGRLGSYTYDRPNGELATYYKVNVKELNFVTPRRLGRICQESQPQKDLGEVGLDEYKTGLHLWKVFFANPSEWLDYRDTKESPTYPDFIHKNTGKALWQWPNDPPWIEKRLEILDRQMGKQTRSERDLEQCENELQLWQKFFANPYEWYDGRETKENPRQPDFVHKHTGEALWLNPRIGKQLESLDLQMAKQGRGETSLEMYKNDLHLWQVFFANPGEWWDNRNRKKNPKAPDFTHKDTRESLWLNPNDPPWVKKQLDLLDVRREEQGLGRQSCASLGDYI